MIKILQKIATGALIRILPMLTHSGFPSMSHRFPAGSVHQPRLSLSSLDEWPGCFGGRTAQKFTILRKDPVMSYSISTLLTRNLQDVFGENDPVRRRAAIDEIWTEDGVFYDPKTGVHRGRDEIDRVAGAIRATHPDFRYQPIAEPEELGNGGRIRWISGQPGEAPACAGTDFIIARDGRVAALYLFFDEVP